MSFLLQGSEGALSSEEEEALETEVLEPGLLALKETESEDGLQITVPASTGKGIMYPATRCFFGQEVYATLFHPKKPRGLRAHIP